MKTYSELCKFNTFKERLDYLRLYQRVAEDIYLDNRTVKQLVYRQPRWKSTRNEIIIRDNACDLGLFGYELDNQFQLLVIHHINPITMDDVYKDSFKIYDPENLITVSDVTHKAIHYGSEDLDNEVIERFENDTIPWKL